MPKRRSSDAHFINLTQEIDVEKLRISIRSDFSDFPDPRRGGNIRYPAWYLLFVILCGYLAGGNTIEDLAHFAELKREWIAEMTGIDPGAAPSYDTIWWFLVRTEPSAFKNLLSRWLKGMPTDLRNQLLNVDGKRLRGISDDEHISHVVELFAAESRLTLAQEKVPDKRSEAVALPALLDMVDVRGAIISMDAAYTHIPDIKVVTSHGADYIVGIKGNQGNLEAEVKNFFDQAHAVDFEEVAVTRSATEDKGHGRLEKRQVTVTNDLEWLPQRDAWGLQSLVEIRSERHIDGVVEQATRYYGSSRRAEAKEFSGWIRGHWAIENSLHYVVDVIFGEDASLSDSGHSAENISLIKRLAMNIVQIVDPKRGMTSARRSATFEPKYLRGLLARVFC